MTTAECHMDNTSKEYTSEKSNVSEKVGNTTIKSENDKDRERIEGVYCNICTKLNIVPVSYVQRRLGDSKIKIRSRGLGPLATRAIAVALVNNVTINHLDLSDNAIEDDGVACIAEMMTENSTILHLDLSENKFGNRGIAVICQAIAKHDTLQVLNLSGTGCTDKETKHIQSMLDTNMHLRELNLSHNKISNEGCAILKRAISDNDTLEVLDLSWNHIRGKGAVLIAEGLKENRGLKTLNVSWNGFAMEGSKALSEALARNKTLTELDVRSNRIHSEAMAAIASGLRRNTSLNTLRMGGNLITPAAATLLLEAIIKIENSPLKELDMNDVVVTKDFLMLLDEIQQKRQIKIKHGPLMTYSNSGKKGVQDGILDTNDPRAILMALMEKDGLRVIDLFQRLDEDNSWTVSRQEFKTGILKANIPITEAQLDDLVEIMDTDRNNEIDLRHLMVLLKDVKRNASGAERLQETSVSSKK